MSKLSQFRLSALCTSTCIVLLAASPVHAMDARSASLGGSAIANAQGVHGALENPSSLMRMHRNKEQFHFHIGASADIHDTAGLIEAAIDNQTLIKDIEDEIDSVSDREIDCPLIAPADTVCLDGTQRLSDLAGTVLDIMEQADNTPVDITAASDVGVAYTLFRFPIALHYRQSISAHAFSDIADSDFAYVNSFNEVFADNELTYIELLTSVPLTITQSGQNLSLGVRQPEDTLESTAQGSALYRQQFGFSIAGALQVAGFIVDVGLTPKFSELTASSIDAPIADEFDNALESFEDKLQNNEVNDDSFTLDVGISTAFTNFTRPIHVSVVGKNLITESISSVEGFEFETTPQLIVGGAVSMHDFTFSADVALNEAKVDNFATQIMAVGVEYDRPIFDRSLFSVRAGLSHDAARVDDATALSLGLSLGPLHVGGRITDAGSSQAGAQLSYSF